MLSAEFSYFGYWLVAPQKASYIGSTPRSGIPARVEKVRHIGQVVKLIGYGTDVNDIQGWYYYDELKIQIHFIIVFFTIT